MQTIQIEVNPIVYSDFKTRQSIADHLGISRVWLSKIEEYAIYYCPDYRKQCKDRKGKLKRGMPLDEKGFMAWVLVQIYKIIAETNHNSHDRAIARIREDKTLLSEETFNYAKRIGIN